MSCVFQLSIVRDTVFTLDLPIDFPYPEKVLQGAAPSAVQLGGIGAGMTGSALPHAALPRGSVLSCTSMLADMFHVM